MLYNPEKKGPAIVIGDACVDVTLKLSEFSNVHETESKRRPVLIQAGGGTSANTAVALAKLGVPTSFMGSLGCDYAGRFMLRDLESAGVSTKNIIVDSELNTVMVFAFINDQGERVLWGYPKEATSYSELDLAKVDLNEVRNARWLHSSGMNYLNSGSIRESLPEIYRIAWEAGVPTSFDLNIRTANPEDVRPEIREAVMKTLPYVTFFLGSAKDEIYSLCPMNDWKDSCRSFATEHRTVIARSGGDGCFAIDKDGNEFEEPSFSVKVVNTTGAGDSFNAGFIAGALSGRSFRESIVWGNGVGAYKVTGNGARYTPDQVQLKAFLAVHGVIL